MSDKPSLKVAWSGQVNCLNYGGTVIYLEQLRLDLSNFVHRYAMLSPNECVLNKAGVKRELLDIVKAKKLAYRYYGHIMRKMNKGVA